MSRRERLLTMVLQVVTVTIVVGLLIFSIVQTNRLAQARARAALELSRQNNVVLRTVEDVLRDVRDAQVNQRRAFRALARRNEQLHGRDPDEAPEFEPLADTSSSNPPQGSSGSPTPRTRTRTDPQEPQPPDERKPAEKRSERRDPKPSPKPSPTPDVCVPLTNVCVDLP